MAPSLVNAGKKRPGIPEGFTPSAIRPKLTPWRIAQNVALRARQQQVRVEDVEEEETIVEEEGRKTTTRRTKKSTKSGSISALTSIGELNPEGVNERLMEEEDLMDGGDMMEQVEPDAPARSPLLPRPSMGLPSMGRMPPR